jgi:UDP-N-acetylglucosamine 2-epimerase (non-hydrolysing)
VRLVGTDRKRIFDAVSEVLTDPSAYDQMSRAHNPYGDGYAAARIVAALRDSPGLAP